MRYYERLPQSPKYSDANFCTDLQGICHDDQCWYISHGAGAYPEFGLNYGTVLKIYIGDNLGYDIRYSSGEKKQPGGCLVYSGGELKQHRFYKYYDEKNSFLKDKPLGIKIGGIHFGDIDCYKGYLFVPVYHDKKEEEGLVDPQILIFSTETFDCVWRERLFKKDGVPFESLAWCAINPLDGFLYTSDKHISNSFEEDRSPLMAYKINFENLEKRIGPVFSCVNKNGILLKIEDTSKLGGFTNTPDTLLNAYDDFCIEPGMQGGCFDPFGTLYLNSGMGRGEINEGLVAFKVFYEKTPQAIYDEYVRTRAYYIWEEKGRPAEYRALGALEDWREASVQIQSALLSGSLRIPRVPFMICPYLKTKKKGEKVSIIDYPILFDNPINSVESEGVCFWDIRNLYKENDPDYFKGMLHAQKLYNNGLSDIYSMENYVIRDLETTQRECQIELQLLPKLRTAFNGVTKRWLVTNFWGGIIKEFVTKEEMENAMLALRGFKFLKTIGIIESDDDRYDLRCDFLIDGSCLYYNEIVKDEVVHFDRVDIVDNSNHFEKSLKGNYRVVFALFHFKDFNETYQDACLYVHNREDAEEIAKLAGSSGYLHILKSSSGRQRDNLYWFEKKPNPEYVPTDVELSTEGYVIKGSEVEIKDIDFVYNTVTKRWLVLNCRKEAIIDFVTKEEMENAMLALRCFKTIKRFGIQENVENGCEILTDGSVLQCKEMVKDEVVHFDRVEIVDDRNHAEKSLKGNYHVLLALFHFKDFNETYQDACLYVQDRRDAEEIVKLAGSSGYLHILKSSSGKQRDNLYWFEKEPNPEYVPTDVELSTEGYVIKGSEVEIKDIDFVYNTVTKRWLVLNCRKEAIIDFVTKEEMENAMLALRCFKTIKRFGIQENVENGCEILTDGSVLQCKEMVKDEVVHFDRVEIVDDRNHAEKSLKGNYHVLLALFHFKDFNETYQDACLYVQDRRDAEEIVKLAGSSGYLHILKSSSGKQRDNLYWFEKNK